MLNFRYGSLTRISLREHWPWFVSMIFLFSALGVSIFLLPEIRTKNQKIERQITAQFSQLTTPQEILASNNANNLPSHLASFNRINVIATDFQELAKTNGLVVPDISFQPETEVNKSEIGHVNVTGHLKGSYPSLKKFLADLTVIHEGLTINSLSVQRNHASDTINEIELHMTFYYRKSP